MLRENYPLFVANRARPAPQALDVTNKYTGEVASRVARADGAVLEEAIAAAARAAGPMRGLKGYQRQAALQHLLVRCEERRDELTEALVVEAGKPIRFARGEVQRLIDTLRVSAEEAPRCLGGEVLPMDVTERAAGYTGMWKRVPVGVCAFITPWNFPLNLVAHKLGPAIACGCPFILKPASATPIGAVLLGEMLAEAELPEGAFSILPLNSKDAGPLVEDDRIRKLSFTGSSQVGWDLKARAPKKHVTLELGGNAGCIVDAGLDERDLNDAVQRLVFGAFYQSGQSCISVQRIYVHRGVYGALRERLVAATRALRVGDPREEETFIGPMITEDDAKRVETWVGEAVGGGAALLCGGKREGATYHATLLEGAPADAKVSREEVFGPVAMLEPFDDFGDALRRVNATRYGLQAGVFTRDVHHVQRAWDELEVGGVIVNDVPSFRVDHMPYGGTKDSGIGREGIRFAIESMTERRLLAMRTPPHVS